MPIPGSPVMETIAPFPSSSPLEGLAQRLELLFPADERRFEACGRSFADAHDAEGADPLAPSLQLEIPELVELEQLVDLVRRRRSHDEIAIRLQARGHVDGIAERVVEDVRRRVAGRNHDRARVDGDARAKLESVSGRDFRGVVIERVTDRERGADGALGVVLVRDGRAEECQDAVAGQLRERTAEALDLLAHQPHDVVEEGTSTAPGRASRQSTSSRRRRRRVPRRSAALRRSRTWGSYTPRDGHSPRRGGGRSPTARDLERAWRRSSRVGRFRRRTN